MKKRLLWLIVPIVLIIGTVVACLKTGELPSLKLVLKMVYVCIAYCVVAFGLKSRKPKAGYKQYADAYKGIIGDAFAGNKSGYNKLMKAVALYNEDKNEKSVKLLNKLLPECASVQEKSAVLIFMGLNYSDSGRHNSAIECYEKLLKDDPKNSRAWSNLGFNYWSIGRTDVAAEAYCNAIEADPTNAYAYNNMANFWYQCGEYEDAITYAEKALGINSRLPQAMSVMALSFAQLGDEDNAVKYGKMYLASGGEVKDIIEKVHMISQSL